MLDVVCVCMCTVFAVVKEVIVSLAGGLTVWLKYLGSFSVYLGL